MKPTKKQKILQSICWFFLSSAFSYITNFIKIIFSFLQPIFIANLKLKLFKSNISFPKVESYFSKCLPSIIKFEFNGFIILQNSHIPKLRFNLYYALPYKIMQFQFIAAINTNTQYDYHLNSKPTREPIWENPTMDFQWKLFPHNWELQIFSI